MIFHTTFRADPARVNEWLACLWQGPAPADLRVREWLTYAGEAGEPRIGILIWEGNDEARVFVERAFGGFGQAETREASSSSGMAAAIARDLEGYESMMVARNVDPAEIARQVDLRRRGMEAADQAAAAEAARAWEAEASQSR